MHAQLVHAAPHPVTRCSTERWIVVVEHATHVDIDRAVTVGVAPLGESTASAVLAHVNPASSR